MTRLSHTDTNPAARVACSGRLAAALLVTLLGACFERPKPECAFRCGPTGECPADYQCAGDGWCKVAAAASNPNHVCEGAPSIDAGAVYDAAVSDPDAGCSAASECPGTDTTCQFRTCDNGVCGLENAASETACTEDSGTVCDGNGACVACVTADQCTGDDVCQNNQCVPAQCENNTLDTGETDVDCGGSMCAPCANDADCLVATDCESGVCNGSNVCAACTGDVDCAADNYCNVTTDACTPTQTGGTSCTAANQCASGNCVDDVCCDTACAGGCDVCSAAAGASADGTCTILGATSECRASAGNCDVAEMCDGSTADCPADGFAAATVECRASAGSCDIAENCTGSSADCPTDAVVAAGVDGSPSCVPYTCDGISVDCRTTCGDNDDCLTGFECPVTSCVATPDPNCNAYCAFASANCTGANELYTDNAACVTYCTTEAQLPDGTAGDMTGNSIACRATFAESASTTPAAMCPSASASGNNVCGTWCENYCHLAQTNCTGANEIAFAGNDCAAECAGLAATGDPGDTTGDTVQCRIQHLGLAGQGASEASTNCPIGAPSGGGVCI